MSTTDNYKLLRHRQYDVSPDTMEECLSAPSRPASVGVPGIQNYGCLGGIYTPPEPRG